MKTNGRGAGPNLDARMVHTEQTEVQKQLDSLNKSDPTAYTKTISEINGVLNPNREAIGNALIQHIRQKGGCDVSNNVTACE